MSSAWKYSEGRLVRVGATAGPEIKPGDPVALVSGTTVSGLLRATPAVAWAWDSSLSQTQLNFRRTFLGIAQDGKASGVLGDITVATAGTHEFPVSGSIPTALNVGAYVGNIANGSALAAQSMGTVTACENAIGNLARPAQVGDTKVLVNVFGQLTFLPFASGATT